MKIQFYEIVPGGPGKKIGDPLEASAVPREGEWVSFNERDAAWRVKDVGYDFSTGELTAVVGLR